MDGLGSCFSYDQSRQVIKRCVQLRDTQKTGGKMDEQNKTNDEQMSKQTQSTSDSNTGSSSVDYEKIADILDKRGTQAQYTALKGYLKEQGVSSDEWF